jgi:hypothetical protein
MNIDNPLVREQKSNLGSDILKNMDINSLRRQMPNISQDILKNMTSTVFPTLLYNKQIENPKKEGMNKIIKGDDFIVTMYEVLITNKKFRTLSSLTPITSFIIMGAVITLFFILYLPSDILFMKNFLKSIITGNFITFLNPFNIARVASILPVIGFSPIIIKNLLSNKLLRKLIKEIILDSYVKVIIIFAKLGKYKYTRFFSTISVYLKNILIKNATETQNESRRIVLESKIKEIEEIEETIKKTKL